MQAVKNKDSKIELMLRRALWSRGIRYRKNVKTVFGHPDIAFLGKKVAVFCDSEFWHGYNWENRKNDFKTNKDFWIPKIERNMKRDIEVTRQLTEDGAFGEKKSRKAQIRALPAYQKYWKREAQKNERQRDFNV